MLATSLGAPTTGLGSLATGLGAPRITVELSGQTIFFGNAAGAPGNHSYKYLSFNDFQNSCIWFLFSSIYLSRYPSTHSLSGPAAGGT